MDPATDAFLEEIKIDIGLDDSVFDANKKRAGKFERTALETLVYASGEYAKQYADMEPGRRKTVAGKRDAFDRDFEPPKGGETQLSVVARLETSLRSQLVKARSDIIEALCQATYNFEPGKMGATCDDDGFVKEVCHDGPARANGIEVGDKIVNVGTEPYSTLVLSNAEEGKSAYNVTVAFGHADRNDKENGRIWIPNQAIIPEQDLHITLSTPRKWHLPMSGDDKAKLKASMENVSLEHAPFVVELDRIILTKGGGLLALFRTVGASGQRVPPMVLDDRCSSAKDPMVALRFSLLDAVITPGLDFHRLDGSSSTKSTLADERPKLPPRQATVALTTDKEGFIHCSLGRLPIAPNQTLQKVDLLEAVKMCSRKTAELSGCRMCISNFELTEMTGTSEYGKFNPFQHARGHQAWEHIFQLKGEDLRVEQAEQPSALQRECCCIKCLRSCGLLRNHNRSDASRSLLGTEMRESSS